MIFLALITLSIVWLGWSSHCFHQWDSKVQSAVLTPPPARALNVALLQPNIPQEIKLASYASDDANKRRELSEYMTALQEKMLAENAKPSWEFVVLPESAFTEFNFFQNEPLKARVSAMARRAGADVLISADRVVPDEKKPEGYSEVYNSVYLADKDGTFDKAIYDKMRLVPFGENLPYFDLIPGFQESIVGIGSFTEGKTQTIFTTKGFRFGVLICFESTFSSLARELAKKGADFLVVVTNDAWYGLSAGAASHQRHSLLRAVETRRWLLRCANTGISSIIAPSGKIEETLGLNQQGFVEGKIAPGISQTLTWFARWGNSWLALPALILLAFFSNSRRKIKP